MTKPEHALRNRGFLALCVAGLAIRGCLLIFTPPEGVNSADVHVYYRTALSLTESREAWLSPTGEFTYRAPLYPAFLFAAYELTDSRDYRVGQLANLLLFLVAMVLLKRLITPEFGAPTALAATGVRALAPPFVISDLLLQTEILFEVFVLASVILVIRRLRHSNRWETGLLLGASLAAATLTREYGLGLIPITVVAFAIVDGIRRHLSLGWWVGFALGVVLVLTPWLARNTFVSGSAFPISSTSGVNLHIGNNPSATGTWMELRAADAPPAQLGFGSRQADAWHRQRALEHIVNDPGLFFRRIVWKLGYLFWPHAHKQELLDESLWPTLPHRLKVGLVAVSFGLTALFWLFGLPGLILSRHAGYKWATLAVLFYSCFVVAVAYGSPRYAYPVIVLLIGPACWIAAEPGEFRERLRRRIPRSITALTIVSLGLLWLLIAAGKFFS
jgi:4-amino-4-deoxy-L-arabinose transferase-like glycosyltransferase